MTEETPTSPATDMEIKFDPLLSPEQVKGILAALSDYYRACGGIGFVVDFEVEESAVRQPEYV